MVEEIRIPTYVNAGKKWEFSGWKIFDKDAKEIKPDYGTSKVK